MNEYLPKREFKAEYLCHSCGQGWRQSTDKTKIKCPKCSGARVKLLRVK